MADISELRIPTDEMRAWNQGDEWAAEYDEPINPYDDERLQARWNQGFWGISMQSPIEEPGPDVVPVESITGTCPECGSAELWRDQLSGDRGCASCTWAEGRNG
ncbi:hypothetical protein [Sciscionella sediminilitoris]|uniref:hypothetical protein n=1 Tax=Sciscionella sediminilitoris TaxID=1445613 RepID=UPI0004DEEE64|nr:hypothetical protein [Sciscionella sp. SE31]